MDVIVLLLLVTLLAWMLYKLSRTNNRASTQGLNAPQIEDQSVEPVDDTIENKFDSIHYEYIGYRFMCKNEKVFYKKLSKVIEGYPVGISVKVRLADLFWNKNREYDPWPIWNKHLDFVLFNTNTFIPLCAVELDGISHDLENGNVDTKKSDIIKDELFDLDYVKKCDVQLFHVKNDEMDSKIQDIKKHIRNHCPKCGYKLKQNAGIRKCCNNNCDYEDYEA